MKSHHVVKGFVVDKNSLEFTVVHVESGQLWTVRVNGDLPGWLSRQGLEYVATACTNLEMDWSIESAMESLLEGT